MAKWRNAGIHVILQEFRDYKSTLSVTFFIGRSLFYTIWQIEWPLFSHWISNIDRSKKNFRPGVISGNPPRSRDILRHYLRSVKIEGWQFSKLIKPINSPFKCDHFLQKNLTPTVNRSQDTRVQIFRKSGGKVAKLFCIKLYLIFQQEALAYFFSFIEFIKSNILIYDSILIKI